MGDDKAKIDCKLFSVGSDKAEAEAREDLTVPDPEPAVGEKLIKDATEDGKDSEDVDQQENS
jgi:hypothetical protein